MWSYTLMDAQLQAAILNHIDTVISVTRSKERLPLVQRDQQHVTTQLQEKRLLEVAEHPNHNTEDTVQSFQSHF